MDDLHEQLDREFPRDGVRAVRSAMQSRDPRQLNDAISWIVERGEPLLYPLIFDALRSDIPLVKVRALFAFAEIPPSDARAHVDRLREIQHNEPDPELEQVICSLIRSLEGT